MPTANQVADWIVRHSADDLGAPVDPMSLEKMLYYAQAFRLVLRDEPLFPDEIRAWQKGPVVKSVWQKYQQWGITEPIRVASDGAPRLAPDIEDFLAQVVGFFGQYTPIRLSEATHQEQPWREAREGFARQDYSDVLIPQMEMKLFYRSLVDDGETALSRHELLEVAPDPRWTALYIAGICERKMTAHPFYDAGLAKKLGEPVESGPSLPDDFKRAIPRNHYLTIDKNTDLDALIKEALAAQ